MEMTSELVMPTIVTLLALAMYYMMSWSVGGARSKYKIKAPKMHGNDNFERVARVHLNTNEQLIIFLPLLWMAALMTSALWASVLGLIWILGRHDYAKQYVAKGNRGRAMITITGVYAILTLMILYKVIMFYI